MTAHPANGCLYLFKYDIGLDLKEIFKEKKRNKS
jgi:hypothetical protein